LPPFLPPSEKNQAKIEKILKIKLYDNQPTSSTHSLQYALEFQSDLAQWRIRVGGASLGGESTHFIQTFKKRVLSRNFGQNIPKNVYRYILEKSCKIAGVSEVRLRTHVGLQRMETTPPDPRVVTPTY